MTLELLRELLQRFAATPSKQQEILAWYNDTAEQPFVSVDEARAA